MALQREKNKGEPRSSRHRCVIRWLPPPSARDRWLCAVICDTHGRPPRRGILRADEVHAQRSYKLWFSQWERERRGRRRRRQCAVRSMNSNAAATAEELQRDIGAPGCSTTCRAAHRISVKKEANLQFLHGTQPVPWTCVSRILFLAAAHPLLEPSRRSRRVARLSAGHGGSWGSLAHGGERRLLLAFCAVSTLAALLFAR